MKIFTEKEIKEHVHLEHEAIQMIAEGFSSLHKKHVQMPPVMRVDIPEHRGEVDVKTAYIPGYDKFAVKLSSGFFDNGKLGLPSGNGLMILISTQTGMPEALMLDNGYLTDVRTAAAGAIATSYLAPEDVKTVGVIGAGTQARFQVKALQAVRPFQKVLVYSPTPERVQRYIRDMSPVLGVPVHAAHDAEEVVKGSQLVVTATPAKSPVIQREWLHEGLHITAMGSDAEYKQELETAVLVAADLLVCDVKSQCLRLGECHHAVEAGELSDTDRILELGELTSGQKTGRTSEQQVTVCDLTGTGVQDTMVALYAYQRLAEEGLGLELGGRSDDNA